MGILGKLTSPETRDVAMTAGGMALLLTGARVPALTMFAIARRTTEPVLRTLVGERAAACFARTPGRVSGARGPPRSSRARRWSRPPS